MGAVQFVYLLARILSPETVQYQRVHLELLGAVTLDFKYYVLLKYIYYWLLLFTLDYTVKMTPGTESLHDWIQDSETAKRNVETARREPGSTFEKKKKC